MRKLLETTIPRGLESSFESSSRGLAKSPALGLTGTSWKSLES